jgi:multisubunit Na+/H+ antiporter MnhE subunit
MSRALAAIWENAYGLLVDDGQLAIGAIAALAIAWLVANLAPDLDRVVGWLLLVIVLALVLANLYRAGMNARRKVAP